MQVDIFDWWWCRQQFSLPWCTGWPWLWWQWPGGQTGTRPGFLMGCLVSRFHGWVLCAPATPGSINLYRRRDERGLGNPDVYWAIVPTAPANHPSYSHNQSSTGLKYFLRLFHPRSNFDLHSLVGWEETSGQSQAVTKLFKILHLALKTFIFVLLAQHLFRLFLNTAQALKTILQGRVT